MTYSAQTHIAALVLMRRRIAVRIDPPLREYTQRRRLNLKLTSLKSGKVVRFCGLGVQWLRSMLAFDDETGQGGEGGGAIGEGFQGGEGGIEFGGGSGAGSIQT